MTIDQFLVRTNYILRGLDEDAPSHGSEEADYWIDTLNRKKDELYEDTSKKWFNLFKNVPPTEPGTVATTATTTLTGTGTYFTDYNVGDTILVSGETVRTIAAIASDTSLTVTIAFSNTASGKTFTRNIILKTGVNSYNLHRSFIGLSGDDYGSDGESTGLYVITTGTNRMYLPVIEPDEQNYLSRAVYISGHNPIQVTFTTDLATGDNYLGGRLYFPGYYMPDDIEDANDELPFIDGGNWACMAVASEIAFNDITFEDKAPDLNTKANNLYTKLVLRNRRLANKVLRPIPTNVRRIRGPVR